MNQSFSTQAGDASPIEKPTGWAGFVAWWRLRAERLSDPETVVSTIIVAVVAILAGLGGGILGIVIVLAIAMAIHITAVESGNYLMLWTATGMLLLLVLVGALSLFGGMSAVMWAIGGSITLVHNELVRVNFARRRNAIIDGSVLNSSLIGVGAASAIGIVASGVAQVVSDGSGGNDRSWLWIVVAFAVLTFVGLAMMIVPSRNTTPRDKEPFRPGERIPPQPLANETITEI